MEPRMSEGTDLTALTTKTNSLRFLGVGNITMNCGINDFSGRVKISTGNFTRIVQMSRDEESMHNWLILNRALEKIDGYLVKAIWHTTYQGPIDLYASCGFTGDLYVRKGKNKNANPN
jgi:hypothetical protein